MMKITPKKLYNYFISHVRSLFSQRTLRYIDWFFKKGKTSVYGGDSFQLAYSQEFGDSVEYNKDVVKCFLKYGFSPRDYMLFGFGTVNKADEQRKTFISDWMKDEVLNKIEGWNNYLELCDKFGLYEKLKPFYKREVMQVERNTPFETFRSFAQRNKHLFIKPNTDSYGNGAMVLDYENEAEIETIFKSLLKTQDSWIIEEKIIQSNAMAKWNDTSVNTVRMNTYLNRNGFFVLAPFMRTGHKGSIVDNGGAGGMYMLINERTGMIISDAYDESGRCFVKHPESNYPFKGEFIPMWSELLAIAEEAHRSIPHHIYVGWDFALSEKGWVLIEGNWGQFICQQTCSKRGYKKEFLQYMNGGVIK